MLSENFYLLWCALLETIYISMYGNIHICLIFARYEANRIPPLEFTVNYEICQQAGIFMPESLWSVAWRRLIIRGLLFVMVNFHHWIPRKSPVQKRQLTPLCCFRQWWMGRCSVQVEDCQFCQCTMEKLQSGNGIRFFHFQSHLKRKCCFLICINPFSKTCKKSYFQTWHTFCIYGCLLKMFVL